MHRRFLSTWLVFGGAVACGSSPPTDAPGEFATLTLVSGGDQTQVAGYVLDDTIVVRLVDGDGAPIAFAEIDGDPETLYEAPFASAVAVDARTRDDGTARFTWRLGLALGPQHLTVHTGAVAAEPLVVAATSATNPMRSLGGSAQGLCGVDRGGRLGCWDPVADADRAPRFTPISSGSFTSVAVYALSGGTSRGCATATNGRIWCFDLDDQGRAGTLEEVPGGYPALDRVRTGSADLAADPPFCALTAAGEAWCWGGNTTGVLGDGSRTRRDDPQPVATAVRFRDLQVGSHHACGLDTSAAGWCWGDNAWAQVGIVASSVPYVTPVHRSGSLRFDAIAPVTDRASCALVEGGGGAYCWGATADLGIGQLATNLVAAVTTPLPIYVSGFASPTAIGRVDGAVVAVNPATGAAWWGDLSAEVPLVRTIDPRRMVRTIGLRTLAIPATRGVVCGALAGGGDDAILCGRMATLTGYPSHQAHPALAGFGMPLP